jgi:hypothetical protein
MIIFSCGLTLLPNKVCAITASVTEINLIGFFIAPTVSWSAKPFIIVGPVG